MTKIEKKREYSHEDMEALGREIEVLRIRARQVDEDIRNGVISHEQWVSAAQELMERKKEILEILGDVDRYKQDLRAEIVGKIMSLLKKIRAEKNKYGALVMRAVNYILDDEEAFKKFLHDGRIEMHNNAVESVFHHILKTRYAHISEQVRAAMGRRCWLNSGSHDAATNIAFMYSLYESCKMNDIDFGEYVEDILTRMMNGDDDYRSMIPCYYTPGKKQEKKVA